MHVLEVVVEIFFTESVVTHPFEPEGVQRGGNRRLGCARSTVEVLLSHGRGRTNSVASSGPSDERPYVDVDFLLHVDDLSVLCIQVGFFERVVVVVIRGLGGGTVGLVVPLMPLQLPLLLRLLLLVTVIPFRLFFFIAVFVESSVFQI